jgi:hypothetical protein
MKNALLMIAMWCMCGQAAMVGDFSPMEVGNKWVYQSVGMSIEEYESVLIKEKTQRGDSVFYTVWDSTWSKTSSNATTTTYLEFGGFNFVLNSLTNKFQPAGWHFKFNQFPENQVYKATYRNDSLYCRSEQLSWDMGACHTNYFDNSWLQNVGHIYSMHHNKIYCNGFGDYARQTLISFNDKPFDYSQVKVPVVYDSPKPFVKSALVPVEKTADQITFRGASRNDNVSFQFYNCLGKMLYSVSSAPGDFVFNTSQFGRGVYVVRYRINNDLYRQSNIIKK